MIYAILILVAYGILGFSFATLLTICRTCIDDCIFIEHGGDFLFVSVCWPVVFIILSYVSVMLLIIQIILKLRDKAIGRYILRILDSWVSWLRS
jgi:hypothetical protein